MQYINNGLYNVGLGMDVIGQPMQSQNQYNYYNSQPQQQMQPNMRPMIDPISFETPNIVIDSKDTVKPTFTVTDGSKPANPIIVDNSSDYDTEKRKRKRNGSTIAGKTEAPKNQLIKADDSDVQTVQGEVVDSTLYTYQETNRLLHETLGQIDAINSELVQEFNNIRHNRTMKNKYLTLNSLSENIAGLLSNRIATIKEINNCITKANDMDYKKYKDIQAAQAGMSDDKYIADLYKAFIQNPNNQAPTYQMPQLDQSIVGSGLVRANVPNSVLSNGGPIDEGYLNYISNLTPEQNLMRYENNPNIKQVVVYDASTGQKFFQMMDMSTMEVIPNLPTYDNNIMEDTTLDLANGVAKNLNLRESFPIIQINNGVTSQY